MKRSVVALLAAVTLTLGACASSTRYEPHPWESDCVRTHFPQCGGAG